MDGLHRNRGGWRLKIAKIVHLVSTLNRGEVDV